MKLVILTILVIGWSAPIFAAEKDAQPNMPTTPAVTAPGVTATEIRIGQTMPYSGPAAAWGRIGLAEFAYLKMINDHGGINGRKIRLISLDDSFSPPKTVEQTRKLVVKWTHR
jgi:branched-chain amino acid transport system substrate-binding protein